MQNPHARRRFAGFLVLVLTLGAVPAQAEDLPAGAQESLATLGQLTVSEERRSGYKRSRFPHWDRLRNRCYVREQVLRDESRTPAVRNRYGCKVLSGTWLSVYDGLTLTDPRTVDIDHVVALAEAWDSGAHRWSARKRRVYANDLADPRSLRAVSRTSNRTKSDQDPAEWLPVESFRCEYVADWIHVKARWGLSVDTAERDALRNVLRSCP